MKYIMLLLLSFLSLNIDGENSVQTCFKGCCFGDSKAHVSNILRDSSIEIANTGDNYIKVSSLQFGGVYFDFVVFHFCKNVLYCVEFYSQDNSLTREVHEKIISKYNCKTFGNEIASFQDKQGCSVCSEFIPTKEYGYLLYYIDNSLKSKCDEDEL